MDEETQTKRPLSKMDVESRCRDHAKRQNPSWTVRQVNVRLCISLAWFFIRRIHANTFCYCSAARHPMEDEFNLINTSEATM